MSANLADIPLELRLFQVINIGINIARYSTLGELLQTYLLTWR